MLLSRLAEPRSTLWLLIAVAALRLPGFLFGILNIDEADLVVMGRLVAEGGIPYVDFVEKKPPLLYLTFAPAGALGFDIWPVQVLACLWIFATCLVVGRVAREWTGRPEVGAVAAWLYALAAGANVVSVNSEILLNLPAAAALLFHVRAERSRRARDELASGLCIGVASLFRQQAGILLVAFVLALVLRWARRRSGPDFGRHAALILGFAVPWALAAGIYAALGHWDAFYEWNVIRNFEYSTYHVGSEWRRFAVGVALYAALAVPLHWWLAARATVDVRGDPVGGALALALWLTWIPVSMSGRFYSHYFLQFAPFLAVLAAPRVAGLLGRWRELRAVARVGFALAAAVPVAGYLTYGLVRGAVQGYPEQDARARGVAEWVRAHAPPDARLFVWGHYSPIYTLAERLPGTRYLITAVHMGDFDPEHLPPGFDVAPHRSARDVAATLRDLEARQPLLVVDTAPADIHRWSQVPLWKFPELARYIERHYELVASPIGVDVYRRRP